MVSIRQETGEGTGSRYRLLFNLAGCKQGKGSSVRLACVCVFSLRVHFLEYI